MDERIEMLNERKQKPYEKKQKVNSGYHLVLKDIILVVEIVMEKLL